VLTGNLKLESIVRREPALKDMSGI